MRPNFFHSSSSSISWQQHQQQQRNKGPFVPFPSPNHMNIDSSSPTHMNYKEGPGDEIEDEHHVVMGGGHELMTSLEKEHMFDKVVTPSDVGKLNRLVIPKQHAEKYFPLDSSTNEKGLLLNFEDRNGKPWRFRYSYWNSSQSYVMTKGWSRFVKDKKLDAGDIVSFSRGVGDVEKDRFFIDWRRRPTAPPPPLSTPPLLPGHHYYSFHPWPGRSDGFGGSGPYILQQQQWSCSSRDHPPQLQQINVMNPSSYSYGGGLMNGNPCPGSLIYFRSPTPHQQVVPAGMGIGMMQGQRGEDSIEEDDPMVFESVPVVVQGKAASKRFRLFGVNMECPTSEDSDMSETDTILSSTAVTHHYPSMAANPPPSGSHSGHFCSSSSSPSSSMRAYPYVGAPLVRKMSSSSSSDKILNKGKGSLSLDFD